MDRFMNGLNYYISHIVELHYYVELEEMVHTVVKVEKQFKQKGTIWQSQPSCPSKPWKPNWKDYTKGGSSQKNEECKIKYPRENKNILVVVKGNNVTPTSRNCDIKCLCCLGFGHIALQCPNKRVMIMKSNNRVKTNGGMKRMMMMLFFS